MTPLDGKVAIITGGGRGIGRAAAQVFARDGAAVVVSDRDEEAGRSTAELIVSAGGTAVFVAADVTVRGDVAALVQRAVRIYGGLHCAFNNAGIVGALQDTAEYPQQNFDDVIAVNLYGTWHCMQEEIPAMLASGGGAIVNASSGLGVVASRGTSAYTASKHAILGLTRAAAVEYAAAGVRVNALLPGVIDTTMPVTLSQGRADVLAAMRAAHPMNRLGTPAEVAEAAAWLCSPRASFVTGHGMAVDGGYLAQ
jgi:NAD(P)-dependent dehydrogenase (short-subunit alcohol dehydrogenase family)